jgi:hypothetical protein
MRDLFKIKKGLDLTGYDFKLIPDVASLASEYKYQLEEAFENDYTTANINRIVSGYGGHDRVGVVAARTRRTKFYLKKAYPTIVELFNYELANQPWETAV